MSKYTLLKEMFTEMVIKKNADLIPHYYHEKFMLYTNGSGMDYAEMLRYHQEIYKTDIQYQVKYEDNTAVEDANKVAVRMYITTSKAGSNPKELELILIAEYQDDKIINLWELTWPDWTQDSKFQNI